jgi:hypothetical protein
MAITYTPTTNFGAKDSLPTNDPDKVIKGSEFTTEFTAIQTAFGLAAPNASPTFTGTVTIGSVDINGGAIDGTTIGGATPAAGSFTTVSATGNITVGGTVDGRDVAADGTKLDGVEAGADVTDTANVTAAGALMDSELTDIAAVKALDQGVATTDSPSFAGLTATGSVSLAGASTSADITFGDNDKAIFGAGSDLQIYHDASDSVILDNGTGNLKIQADDLVLKNADGSKEYLKGTNGGSVRIRYNNTTVLETTATGIDVTGTVTADGLTVGNATAPIVTLDETGTGTVYLVVDGGSFSVRPNSLASSALRITSDNDVSLYDDTGTTPKFFWDASSEKLSLTGDGNALSITGATQSIAGGNSNLKIGSNDTAAADKGGQLNFTANTTSSANYPVAGIHGYHETVGAGNYSGYLSLFTTTSGGSITERLRITSAGNVGIGTSSPAVSGLEISRATGDATPTPVELRLSTTTSGGGWSTTDPYARISFYSADTSGSGPKIMNTIEAITTSATGAVSNLVFKSRTNKLLELNEDNSYFYTGNTERMRIDSSGNLIVGGATVAAAGSIALESDGDIRGVLASGAGGDTLISAISGVSNGYQISVTTGNAQTYKWHNGGAQSMTLDSSGNVGIGTTPAAGVRLDIRNNSTTTLADMRNANASGYGIYIAAGSSSSQYTQRWADYANNHLMTLDSSGNLLVGKTASGISNAGVELRSTGEILATRAGQCFDINRTGFDGIIMQFRKDGAGVGSIGTAGGGFYLGNAASLAYANIRFTNNEVFPCQSAGGNNDDAIDLGKSNSRWRDIYAGNGTINTSDRREKQDIEELSEAERRVAVACKGLLRKFRWISSVEEKGDEARIHFGIIAQDLQAAFEAEGLDAGRYAMFIHSTWTDEETGEERSRMGVRYSELLAFIIAAL